MRTTYTMMLGLLLGAGALSTGCSSTSGDAATGSSQARVIASSQGSGTTTMHVTGTDNATSLVTIDKTIEVTSGDITVVDLSMPPSTYTFKVDLLSGTTTLGTSSAQASLTDGVTTQIALAAQASAMGDVASMVQIGVDVAPQITGVAVQASTTTAAGMTQIQVTVSDPNADALSFYWSGATLDGAIHGTDTMTISTAAITAAAATGTPTLHVVVQDANGGATAASIALSVASSGVEGSIATSSDGGAALQACLDTAAQCSAGCAPGVALGTTGVTIDATCLASCSTTLVSCEGT